MAKRKKRPPAAAPAGGGRFRFGWALWVLVGLTAALGAFLFAREQARGGGDAVEPPARGLPATPDYHALFVFPDDPEHLLLGTHVGVYESTDGGVRWRFLGLEGRDAMGFGFDGDALWVAGHEVLERSGDGGRTWETVEPEGLPHRDIHGFTIGPERGPFYAALAGEGLFRSDDGGESFRRISEDVGGDVYGLAVAKDGVVYAADPTRGVLVNAAGDGKAWAAELDGTWGSVAANVRDDPNARVLAGGVTLQLSDGRRFREVLSADEPFGPVAFAPSDPDLAYAVAYDRKLYRSEDGGETWEPVT